MEQSVFFEQLAEITDTEPSNVKLDSELESLGWTSLAVISFIALAEENFGMILQPRKIAACKTVADLVQLLDGNVTA